MYGLPLALTQWLDFGNIIWIRFFHMFIGCIGIFSFYKILQFIFKNKYNLEILLVTSIFAVHPLFLAHSLMPNLDFPVTSFLLAMVASLLYGRHGLFLLFALFSIFTREVGISFYLAFFFSYVIAFISRKKNRDKQDYKLLILLITPLLFFGLFLIYKAVIGSNVFWQGSSTHAQPISILPILLNYELTNPVTITNLLQIFVLNFNWIFTLFILLYLGGKYSVKRAAPSC